MDQVRYRSYMCIRTKYVCLGSVFLLLLLFSVRLLSVLHDQFVLFPPQRPMTSDFEGFSIPDFIHYIYFPFLFLEIESVFHKGTTRYHFITSLVWRGPWLGIEPGTSGTRCQHSTTRISRRRLGSVECWYMQDIQGVLKIENAFIFLSNFWFAICTIRLSMY